MKTLHVNIPGREYDIVSQPGLLDQAGQLLRPILKGRMAAIVTDSNVEPLYAARLARSRISPDFRPPCWRSPPGRPANARRYLPNCGSR